MNASKVGSAPNSIDKNVVKKKKSKRKFRKQVQRKENKEGQRSLHDSSANAVKTPSQKKRKKGHYHTKDSADVASYLSTWKAHQTDSKVEWRFNKNTQSWLIRHMYETDKVSKSIFSLLVDYLQGLQGESVKQRLVEEATRRALRYKDYEKQRKEGKADATETKVVQKASEGEMNSGKQDLDEDDDVRWSNLDDHKKRKEYKRARIVLDNINFA